MALTKRKLFPVVMDDRMIDALKRLAQAEHRSASAVIRELVSGYILAGNQLDEADKPASTVSTPPSPEAPQTIGTTSVLSFKAYLEQAAKKD